MSGLLWINPIKARVCWGKKATGKHSHLERTAQGQSQDDLPCCYPQPVFAGENAYCVQSQSEGENLCKWKRSFWSIMDQQSIAIQSMSYTQWVLCREIHLQTAFTSSAYVSMYVFTYTIFHLPFTAHHAVIFPLASAFCLKIFSIVRNT